MRNFPSSTAARAAVVLSLLGVSAARADSIQVNFSGVFDQTFCFECSAGSAFEALVGTAFSGSVRFPASQSAAVSTDLHVDPGSNGSIGTHALRADYQFDAADVSLQLHTALPAFDPSGGEIPVVMVQDCTDDVSPCQGQSDFLWIMLTTANYRYTLATTLVGGVNSVDIPSLAQLQASAMVTYFDIESLDFSDSVTVALQVPTPMTVNYSGVASPVPLGGTAPLFALSVAGLGLASARRQRRR